jgi:hypothetical protein
MAKIISNDEVDETEVIEQDTQDQQLDDVLDELDEETQELENMTEVEVRLEEANYFKALLQNPLFSDTDSPIAERVEKRVRGFIQSELRILLGLETRKLIPIQAQSNFTQEEEKVLKALAGKVLSKEKVEQKSEPTVNTATLQPVQQVKPVTVTQAVVKKPVAVRGRPPVAKTKKEEAKKETKVEAPLNKPKTVKIKRIVNTPEGPKEVEIDVPQSQTQPSAVTKRHQTLTQAEVNNIMQQSAIQEAPGGILGQALNLINPALSAQLIIDDSESGDYE